MIDWTAERLPDHLKSRLVNAAQGGLDFLALWNRVPDQCSCQGSSSDLVGYLGLGPQAAWAYASEPAERYGTKIVENLVDKQVPRWWRRLPLIRSLPGKWGYKTVQAWEASPPISGALDDLVSPGMPRGNGLHYIGENSRYTLNTRFRVIRNGWKGAAGTIALAGIIDGIFQFASDAADPCFSLGQRLNRAAAATVFGLAAGAAGAFMFGIAVAATAPAWVAIGVSFVAGAVVSMALTPYKEDLFDSRPEYFGN